MFKLLCLIISSAATALAEPECSRFHYEEKTLEKMVRLEFLVEQFKVEMDTFRKEKEELFSEIKKEFANEMNNAKESVEADKARTLARALSKIQAMKHNMTDEISKAIQQVQEGENRVFFRAKTVKNRSPSRGEVFIFSETISDTDDVYSNKTGRFVAPVSGTYVFNTHICSIVNVIYFSININNVGIARSSTYKDYNCNLWKRLSKCKQGAKCMSLLKLKIRKYFQTTTLDGIPFMDDFSIVCNRIQTQDGHEVNAIGCLLLETY